MTRSRTRALALSLCLALLGLQGARLADITQAAPAPVAEALDVEGTGWKSALVCMGCIAGTATLISTGGFLAAAMAPGSTLVLAGCIYACQDAY